MQPGQQPASNQLRQGCSAAVLAALWLALGLGREPCGLLWPRGQKGEGTGQASGRHTSPQGGHLFQMRNSGASLGTVQENKRQRQILEASPW